MKINKPMLFNGQYLATYVKLFEKLGLTSSADGSSVSGIITKDWILGSNSKNFTGENVFVTAAGTETIAAAIERLTTAVAQVKQYNVVAADETALEVTSADATAQGITTTTFTVGLNLADNSLEQSADGLKVKVADKTLVLSNSGLASGIKLAKLNTATDGFAASYQLVDAEGTALANSAVINIPKDQFLKSAEYDATTETINFTFEINAKDADGKVTSTEHKVSLPVGDLIDTYNAGAGLAVDKDTNTFSVKVADDGTRNFVTVDANGLHLATETTLTADSDVKLPTSKAVADYVSGYVYDQAKTAYSAVVKYDGILSGTVENAPKVNTLYVDNDGQTGIVLADQTAVIDISQEFITSLDSAVDYDERLITAGAVKAAKAELDGAIDNKVDKVAGAANNLVVFGADGAIADSGKTIATEVVESANVVTASAVKKYVDDAVSGLNTDLAAIDKFELVSGFVNAPENGWVNDKLYFTAEGQAKVYDGGTFHDLSMEASTDLANDASETKVVTAKAAKDYVDDQTTEVKAKAVEMLEQEVSVGGGTTATVSGRVIAVYDETNEQCYPTIAYANGVSTISVDVDTLIDLTVLYAKRINADNGTLA